MSDGLPVRMGGVMKLTTRGQIAFGMFMLTVMVVLMGFAGWVEGGCNGHC